jgi:hypothetical protein
MENRINNKEHGKPQLQISMPIDEFFCPKAKTTTRLGSSSQKSKAHY